MIFFNSRDKIEKFAPHDFLLVISALVSERANPLQLKVVQRLAEHQVEVDRWLGGSFTEIQIQM